MKTYHGKAFLIEARISSLMFILCHGEHQGPNTLWAKNTGMSSCNINLAAIQDATAEGGCGLPGPGRPAGGWWWKGGDEKQPEAHHGGSLLSTAAGCRPGPCRVPSSWEVQRQPRLSYWRRSPRGGNLHLLATAIWMPARVANQSLLHFQEHHKVFFPARKAFGAVSWVEAAA